MRLLLVAVLLALASCERAPANAAQLAGTYQLVRLNGSGLPVPYPGNDNALIEEMTWVLGADKWLTMTFQVRNTTSGTSAPYEVRVPYRVEGNTIVPEGDGAPAGAFRWVLCGSELRLTDKKGTSTRSSGSSRRCYGAGPGSVRRS